MNFTSGFYLLFFPLVYCVYRILPRRFHRSFLLAVSYGFYMSFRPLAAVLLAAVTLVTFASGKGMESAVSLRIRRIRMAPGIVFPLLLLILFKNERIALVAGISFYTFQSLSYVLEVYRGKLKAEESLLTYALYVAFFPQLVAGPIERPDTLLAQLKKEKPMRREDLREGVCLLLRGYFKKLVLADMTAVFADRIFETPALNLSAWAVLFGAMLFALQIYGDFSGYTDIARGCALFFGIRLSENFRLPYLAHSVGDFWRRWHITLTEWFMDYVYIPLGGNRKGSFRTFRNILLVFLLSGLWHGLALHFVVWGLMQAAALIIERILKRTVSFRLPAFLSLIGTFLLVSLSWIFFRAKTTRQAFVLLGCLGRGWGRAGLESAFERMQMGGEDVLWILLGTFAVYRMDLEPELELREGRPLLLLLVILAAWLVLLAAHQDNAFIYFRF